MNAQRLVRQLRKEIKTNPKRAMLLAGLMAVGIYFWAPLVAGWVMPPDKGPVVAAPKKSAASQPATTPTTPEAANNQIEIASWTKLWAAIQSDSRTKPAITLATTVDPFKPFPVPEDIAEAEAAKNGTGKTTPEAAVAKAAVVTELTPKSLGMKLTGTIIGGRRRAAVIDGKVVAEGATVISGGAAANSTTTSSSTSDSKNKPKPSPAKTPRVAFRLSQVHAQSVVLERDAKPFVLSIEQPQFPGIEFAPTTRQAQ